MLLPAIVAGNQSRRGRGNRHASLGRCVAGRQLAAPSHLRHPAAHLRVTSVHPMRPKLVLGPAQHQCMVAHYHPEQCGSLDVADAAGWDKRCPHHGDKLGPQPAQGSPAAKAERQGSAVSRASQPLCRLLCQSARTAPSIHDANDVQSPACSIHSSRSNSWNVPAAHSFCAAK